MKKFITAVFIIAFLAGCGVMDVRNTAVMTLGKKSANTLDLSEYGYKNGRYQNLDVGRLHLKTAYSDHKIDADDVKIFFYSVPKSCRFIGWVTIENPNGLKDIGIHYGIGKFDTESYEFKRLRKAASLLGVKWISYRNSKPKIVQKGSYYIGYYGDIIRVFTKDKSHKMLCVSVKGYECK